MLFFPPKSSWSRVMIPLRDTLSPVSSRVYLIAASRCDQLMFTPPPGIHHLPSRSWTHRNLFWLLRHMTSEYLAIGKNKAEDVICINYNNINGHLFVFEQRSSSKIQENIEYLKESLIFILAMSEIIHIKIVAVGDGSSGKTQLLIKLSSDASTMNYVPTVFDNYSADVNYKGNIIKLGLWDTAGAQQYNRLRPLAYPKCDVFVIIFNLAEKSSFVNACKKWFVELQEAPPAPILFIGNKFQMNLPKMKDQVDSKLSKSTVQKQFKRQYMECNTLTGEGTKAILYQIIQLGLQKKEKPLIKKKSSSHCQMI